MTKVTSQKGAANSNPSWLRRWFISQLLQRASSEKRLLALRKKHESKRQKEHRAHIVEYFHQVDDAYSHLTLQLLSKLTTRYDIELVIHLVSGVRDENFPEPDLWKEMALKDASQIAPYYQLTFPENATLPNPESCLLAKQILCQLSVDEFCNVAVSVSDCLWRNDNEGLEALRKEYGVATIQDAEVRLNSGNQRRKALKHFGSANFWYEGEWYWKIDRIYHLEQRLKTLGTMKYKHESDIAPMQEVFTKFNSNVKSLTLEYFVSLRSPYTAVSWQPTMKLVKESGINLIVRPVLPMVMRGVPATYEKGIYFWSDAAREARAKNVDFKKFYDPVGTPVIKGYNLYMWAQKQGKGNALIEAFLTAAFAKGINLNTNTGLKKLIDLANLDWSQAKQHLNDNTWQNELEKNRLAMYEFGNWGVPAYRLLDQKGKVILGVWGQDRLWLVSRKIEEILNAD